MTRVAGMGRGVPDVRFNAKTPQRLREVLRSLWRHGYHVRLDYGDRNLTGYLTRNPASHRLVLVRSREDRIGDLIDTAGITRIAAAPKGAKKVVYDDSISS